MHALAGGVDTGNFRNSFMSLKSEASRVSFLNQTLLQIENYIKMDNLPFNAMTV